MCESGRQTFSIYSRVRVTQWAVSSACSYHGLTLVTHRGRVSLDKPSGYISRSEEFEVSIKRHKLLYIG